MSDKLKGQTISFQNPPLIVNSASIVGPEEGQGPLGDKFDLICDDVKCGKNTWEKGEKKMVSDIIKLTLDRASVSSSDLDFIIGGDLLNQIVTSNYVARDLGIPFLGVYGACSTIIEALSIGAILMDGGYADAVLSFTSSHYQTAERQFRTPLEYGDQYTSCNQQTVTGAGAYLLGWLGGQVRITHSTIGKVIDLGATSPTNMGGAMAPAAADTIIQHFLDLGRGPQDYDLILTGDLGRVGRNILNSLLEENNIVTGEKLQDCGALIFGDNKKFGAGGSGCAASATVLSSTFIPQIISGKINRLLIVGTGALFSPLTVQQKESIPCIAHGIVIEGV